MLALFCAGVYLYIIDNDEHIEPEPQGHTMSHTSSKSEA